jgi:hypothetical protein
MAGLELAHRLTEGPDGGVLNLLLAAGDAPPAETRRSCEAILERLIGSLGLETLGRRGEFLRLGSEQVGEFEVRGGVAGGAAFYRVVRPGWALGGTVVARPVVEPSGGIDG